MRAYCTYFDHRYLPRGLALYHSLRRHGGAFRLWVLCLNETCLETLLRLKLPSIEPISLAAFEQSDAPLAAAKANRSLVEYYFTCTPSLPLYILKQNPEINAITYLDADLYFFADPEQIHAETGVHSIAITPHRFPAARKDRERFGIYNVGWLTFRHDAAGLACLDWWRSRCLDWCYDRCEANRFADQKYLDDWPQRFPNVKTLDHPGINLALWNLAGHRLRKQNDRIFVDRHPLIFYHFHGLKQLSHSIFDPQWSSSDIKPSGLLRCGVYIPYLRAVQAAAKQTAAYIGSDQPLKSIRKPSGGSSRPFKSLILNQIQERWQIWRRVLTGKYLWVPERRTLFSDSRFREPLAGYSPSNAP